MLKGLIVGYGFMGKTHALVYEGISDVALVGIVDSYLESAEVMLSSGKMVPVFKQLEQALAATNPDFVDLCVPTDLHVSLGLTVLKAGKSLFCEKPIALDLEGATQLEEARQKAGVQSMVGHCIRFWPEYRFLARFLEAKTWGKLRSLSLRRHAARPSAAAQNWVADPSRCKGAVLDLHIHDTDFVVSLFGKPAEVTSRGVCEPSGWNWIATDYAYPEVIVRAEGGWNLPSTWRFEMSYRAIFEGGVVDYSTSQTPAIQFFSEAGFPEVEWSDPAAAAAGAAGAAGENLAGFSGYVETLRYFIGKLKSKEPIEESTLAQATESLSVTLGEIRSIQEKKTVSFGAV